MSNVSISIFFLILLIVTPMMYFFFKPKFHIKYYAVNNSNLSLEVYSKLKACGFINLNNENIVYQYSLGLYGKKGLIDLNNTVLYYQDNKILFNTKQGKNIISLECPENIYNETVQFLNDKMKIRNSPDYKSKKDLFFNN